MLRYLYGRDLAGLADLRRSMLRDRADQFGRRMGWPVEIDADGCESDAYDALDPLYVIWQRPDGLHGGSARFLPTTGRTMVNDHFRHLGGGIAFRSPFIWECTRFCLAPGADGRVAAALMLGGGALMRGFGIDHLVGVFDARMLRVYRMLGASPEVLGMAGTGADAIGVGLWSWRPDSQARLLRRAGLWAGEADGWFARAFGRPASAAMTG